MVAIGQSNYCSKHSIALKIWSHAWLGHAEEIKLYHLGASERCHFWIYPPLHNCTFKTNHTSKEIIFYWGKLHHLPSVLLFKLKENFSKCAFYTSGVKSFGPLNQSFLSVKLDCNSWFIYASHHLMLLVWPGLTGLLEKVSLLPSRRFLYAHSI